MSKVRATSGIDQEGSTAGTTDVIQPTVCDCYDPECGYPHGRNREGRLAEMLRAASEGVIGYLDYGATRKPAPRRTCRTPYPGGTCGCGCGCDENRGRPEDGTCDCSECYPGQVVGDAKCAECGHAAHPPRACDACGCLWGLPVPGYGLPSRGGAL